MANTQISPQDLLDQILSAGRELAEKGKTNSGELTARGKDIAAKGENILVEKLGIEDNAVSRDALRKGAATGAAAGALALLLSSRSGRKVMKVGGLAGLGLLAYRAHKAGKMPTSAEDVIGLLKGPEASQRADILLQAMVAAAQADGKISEGELELLQAHNGASVGALEDALASPANPETIAALADSDQARREIYAVSCRVANGLNPKERDYLDRLAMAMRLDPDLAAKLETDMRTG